MTTQNTDDEAEIRKHYRDIRDKLKSASTRLDMISKIRLRPEIRGLYGNQASAYEWLMTVFDEIERLKLEINALKTDEQIVDALEKIRAWQRTYQPSLDVLRKDHDKLKGALRNKTDDKTE